MFVMKCKMCGGDLYIIEDMCIAECEHCGSLQTVPSLDHEKKTNLFSRANRLRMACEFDKAAGVYESIAAEFPYEAEAYWGLVLCRYGIEYVDDPMTHKMLPTSHRFSFDSVLEDENYNQAVENADPEARRIYRGEAKDIERLRQSILTVMEKEEPYDVFICYKETDEKGDRTIDSVIAHDVYDALTAAGYRVFFSRVSLEDKLGTNYEPYIFAALHSAKIMLAFGTDYEYYNAVWVKNEWSRYLSFIAAGEHKTLIPCYRGIDAYDMPQEFRHLQAQDMGKLGAIQDLLRGIEKILSPQQASVSLVSQISQGPTVTSLLKRGSMAMQDKDWSTATECFEKILNIDPEYAEAHLGLLCVHNKVCSKEEIAEFYIMEHLSKDANGLKRVQKYGDMTMQKWLASLEAERCALIKRRQAKRLIAIGNDFTVAVRTDGKILTTGGGIIPQSNINILDIVKGWRRVKALSGYGYLVVGLQADGTPLDTSDYGKGMRFNNYWKNLCCVAVTPEGILGALGNGEVVSLGEMDGYSTYRCGGKIVDLAGRSYHSVALRTDGRVIVNNSLYEYAECDVSDWQGVRAVAVGDNHTVGLLKNGTVIATGWNDKGQCDVSEWENIVSIAACSNHTLGVKADGTVVATGENLHNQLEVADWKDVVAVVTGSQHTVGIRKDGTLIAAGLNNVGQCNVMNWRLFEHIDNLSMW